MSALELDGRNGVVAVGFPVTERDSGGRREPSDKTKRSKTDTTRKGGGKDGK
jgi:hypothetical protein